MSECVTTTAYVCVLARLPYSSSTAAVLSYWNTLIVNWRTDLVDSLPVIVKHTYTWANMLDRIKTCTHMNGTFAHTLRIHAANRVHAARQTVYFMDVCFCRLHPVLVFDIEIYSDASILFQWREPKIQLKCCSLLSDHCDRMPFSMWNKKENIHEYNYQLLNEAIDKTADWYEYSMVNFPTPIASNEASGRIL